MRGRESGRKEGRKGEREEEKLPESKLGKKQCPGSDPTSTRFRWVDLRTSVI